jgi:hypothetical protein
VNTEQQYTMVWRDHSKGTHFVQNVCKSSQIYTLLLHGRLEFKTDLIEHFNILLLPFIVPINPQTNVESCCGLFPIFTKLVSCSFCVM